MISIKFVRLSFSTIFLKRKISLHLILVDNQFLNDLNMLTFLVYYNYLELEYCIKLILFIVFIKLLNLVSDCDKRTNNSSSL